VDYSSTLISLLIILYGLYEYRRRERAHSAALERLSRGETLSIQETRPALWRLFTTGSVCIALAAFAALLITTGLRSGDSASQPLGIMGCMVLPPLLLLLLILVRDVREYKALRREEKEPAA
jgi:hypothetical protein